MTELEWKILDEVYLMNAYSDIVNAVQENEPLLDQTLTELLQKKWLRQLMFDEALKDYTDVDPFDALLFKKSHFVITRQGLLQHTGTA